MPSFNLLILALAVTSASACTYWCNVPSTGKYICCDEGNPFLNETEIEKSTTLSDETTETGTTDETTDTGIAGAELPSRCFYYCSYEGLVYCCGDSSRPIPESHEIHDGGCPEEEDQVCKNTGIFLNNKKYKGKTSGAIRLVAGNGKEQLTCASDGYCAKHEKCCPSKCAHKHICMMALDGNN